MDPVSMTLMAAGTAVKGYSEYSQGQTQAGIMQTEAASLDKRASWERAMGTHRQAERERETQKLLSQQIAAGAASGGGTEGSVEAITGATRQRSTFLSMLDQATAEEQARGVDDQAALRRRAAEEARRGSKLRVLGTVLGGASQMMGGKIPGYDGGAGGDSWTRGTTVARYA